MKAAVYEEFGKPLSIQNVADPTPDENGVVIEVKVNGTLSLLNVPALSPISSRHFSKCHRKGSQRQQRSYYS
jgi:hypothetical protein